MPCKTEGCDLLYCSCTTNSSQIYLQSPSALSAFERAEIEQSRIASIVTARQSNLKHFQASVKKRVHEVQRARRHFQLKQQQCEANIQERFIAASNRNVVLHPNEEHAVNRLEEQLLSVRSMTTIARKSLFRKKLPVVGFYSSTVICDSKSYNTASSNEDVTTDLAESLNETNFEFLPINLNNVNCSELPLKLNGRTLKYDDDYVLFKTWGNFFETPYQEKMEKHKLQQLHRTSCRRLFMEFERLQIQKSMKNKFQKQRIAHIKISKEFQRNQEEKRVFKQINNATSFKNAHSPIEERTFIKNSPSSISFKLENSRYIRALKSFAKEKLNETVAPRMCPCASSIFEADPYECHNNCLFYWNPKLFIRSFNSIIRTYSD